MGWYQFMLKPISWKRHCACYLFVALILLIVAFKIEEVGRMQQEPLIHNRYARDFNCKLIGGTFYVFMLTELLLHLLYK
jgi:hypothetical protein